MMQLVSSNGTVLLEREKPSTKRANNSTLHVRRMSQGIKKTVRPVLMSKEEFFTKVIKTNDDAYLDAFLDELRGQNLTCEIADRHPLQLAPIADYRKIK